MLSKKLACLLALTLGLAGQAVAETVATKLRSAEAQGLSEVNPDRIKALVATPAAVRGPVGQIELSKSWIDAQPRARGGNAWACLSEALYFEARGETVKGMFAVAEVIMNRVKSTRFPDDVCGVINQGTGKRYQCQFTYTCDGKAETIHEPRAFDRVGKIARLTLDGQVPALTNGATHYHTTAVRPNWSRVYTRTARYGVHLFYRHTYRSAKN